jgi:hypothetical protein
MPMTTTLAAASDNAPLAPSVATLKKIVNESGSAAERGQAERKHQYRLKIHV